MDGLLNPGDLERVGDLAAREAWIPLVSCVILLLVRALRSPRVPWPLNAIPAHYRPLVAIGLGIVSGVVDRIVNGTPWRAAVLSGLVSAALAALTHDTAQGVQKASNVQAPENPNP